MNEMTTKGFYRVPEREGDSGRARRWLAPLFVCASLGASCSDDDPLDPEGTSGDGGSAGSSGGRDNEDGGSAGLDSGGASGNEAGSAGSATSGGSAGAAGGSSAANGETGIFVGMTEAHNRARAALDVSQPLPDLSWSEELAVFAQDWSDNLAGRCGTIEHRSPNSYGENIAMRASSRLVEPFSPEEAVANWVAEEACWTFGTILGTDSCDLECTDDLNASGCGHYTQVVWRTTARVGCGYSTCEAQGATYEIWVCNYDPPGNYIGFEPY